MNRVERFVKHARQLSCEDSGEFAWEADIWSDVFGLIRDDDRVKMFVTLLLTFSIC